jgi:ABC-type Zn uptake system ZnuABC Zn-binding protein ZnuA
MTVELRQAALRMLRLLFVLGAFGGLAAGCRAAETTSAPETTALPLAPLSLAPGAKLRVLATTSIVADVVQAAGGERLEVTALVPAGVDPHAFEPAPQDVRRVAEAQLLVENGLGLEAFLQPLLRNASTQSPVISLAQGIEPLPAGDHAEGEEEHGAWDPHLWLDPRNVIVWTHTLEDSLTALDPSGAADYARLASGYRTELETLDAELQATFAALPSERRVLVTDHEEFAYFARRYGFTVVGTVIPAPSAAAEPSAQDLAALEKAIRSTGVQAVFVSSVVSPALARQVAEDTGVQLVSLYAHSLSAADGPAPTYLEMMRYDARLIAEALTR